MRAAEQWVDIEVPCPWCRARQPVSVALNLVNYMPSEPDARPVATVSLRLKTGIDGGNVLARHRCVRPLAEG